MSLTPNKNLLLRFYIKSFNKSLSGQVVEITKGSKVKYELDKKTGLIKVSEMK